MLPSCQPVIGSTSSVACCLAALVRGPSLVAMTFRLPLPLNTAHNAQALHTGHFLQIIVFALILTQ